MSSCCLLRVLQLIGCFSFEQVINFNGCETKCVGVLKGKEVQSMIIAVRRWLILLAINMFCSVVRVQLSQVCWGICDVQLHQFVCNNLACVYIVIVLLHLVVCHCIILNGFDLDRGKSVSEGPFADFFWKTELWENIKHPFIRRCLLGPACADLSLIGWWNSQACAGWSKGVFDSPKLKILTSSHGPNSITVAQQYVTKLMVILNFKCNAQIFA